AVKSDFILATAGEELGFLGLTAIFLQGHRAPPRFPGPAGDSPGESAARAPRQAVEWAPKWSESPRTEAAHLAATTDSCPPKQAISASARAPSPAATASR
ncbi:hypothetical protein, partial [Streptomyces sp. NPDC003719]